MPSLIPCPYPCCHSTFNCCGCCNQGTIKTESCNIPSSLTSRRNFLKVLACSVVAAGLPLPIGFPEELTAQTLPPGQYLAVMDEAKRHYEGMIITWKLISPKERFKKITEVITYVAKPEAEEVL